MSQLEDFPRASCDIVHRKFVPQDQTINREFYLDVLKRLREGIRRMLLDLWRAKNCIIHDVSALCHQALLTREFLAISNIASFQHLPYSSDLAIASFHIFPMIKKQHHCQEPQRIGDSTRLRKTNFQAGLQKWQESCHQFIAA
ncbi:uncharacterized protein LOC118763780 [Octopus sinensis]|uniref:Uncharacterized protein LOC118763780 n=1 Tax=Octopus sinensis TaxID=2607531 RepID=A0A7E6EVM2_9MOLL|nr:uncharacterized protein LOC118763780 [Octopus sinensis]